MTRWRARKVVVWTILGMQAHILCAGFTYLVMHLPLMWRGDDVGRRLTTMVLGMFVVCIPGGLSLPLVWAFLRRRRGDAGRRLFRALAITGAICGMLGFLELGWIIAPVVALFWSAYWWALGPRAFDGPNRCRNCGYDLTGNTSGMCPECGVSIDFAESI